MPIFIVLMHTVTHKTPIDKRRKKKMANKYENCGRDCKESDTSCNLSFGFIQSASKPFTFTV